MNPEEATTFFIPYDLASDAALYKGNIAYKIV